MGTPYTRESLALPQTIVYGAYPTKVYEQIKPIKISLSEPVTTPAECSTLVHRDHRTVTTAEYSNVGGEWYSNVGGEWCKAVFDA